MKHPILISLICAMSFFSCKESKQKIAYIPPVFNEIIKRPITVIGDTIDDLPGECVAFDDFLILAHRSMKNEQLFHVYNRYSGEYKCSFGNRGRGFGELIHINGISIDKETSSMLVGSLDRNQIFEFALDSLKYGKVNVSEKRLKQPLRGTGFYQIGRNRYLSIYNPFQRFQLYDDNLNIIDSCDYHSQLVDGEANTRAANSYYMYCSNIGIKSDGSKFVNLTLSGGVLEIFEIKEDKIRHLKTDYYYQPIYDEKSGIPKWNEAIFGAITLTATDKYIYVLFNGTVNSEAKVDKVSVLDWDGKPVRQYDLGVDLMRVMADEEAGKGYIIFRDDNYEYRLGTFDL